MSEDEGEDTPDVTTALDRVEKEIGTAERHLRVLTHVVADGPIGIVELGERTDRPHHELRHSLRVLEEEALIEPGSSGAIPADDAQAALAEADEQIVDLAERVGSMRVEFGDGGESVRCRLLGHEFGDGEVEREREERGEEVVVTTREVERCRRCGERRVVSEETAVDSGAATIDRDERDSKVGAASADDGRGEKTAGHGESEETVEAGDGVRLAYTVRTLSDETLVDTTDRSVAAAAGVDEGQEFGPRTVVAGAGEVFAPVDEALIGSRVGETGHVKVPAAEAFGEHDDSAVRTIDAERIDADDRYPGARVTVDGENGHVETVVGGRARVDCNHPLAGEDLDYEYEVLEVEPGAVLYEFRDGSAADLVEGRRYRGRVEDVRDSIAFVSLAPGVTGVMTDAATGLAPGDEVVVRVDRVADDGTVDFGWVDRQEPEAYRERAIQGDDGDAGSADGDADGDAGSDGGGAKPDDNDAGRPEATVDDGSSGDDGTGLGPPASGAVPDGPSVAVDPEAVRREESIGVGGNADVSLVSVEADGRERQIAFKEPRVGGTIGREVVDSLLAEAQRWAKLDDHDNVVDVIDWGADPAPWIAMEYMDGGDLAERAGSLPVEQACWTAARIAEGVYHAHRHGVAHLDLKPANVLFRGVEGAWDVPKVADWGLSRELLDHSGSVDGLSVRYAAPEQIDAETFGTPDDVTDVYGLGAVCYELFTGRPPFEGPTYEVLDAVRTEAPPPPSDVANAPPALDEVLLTALATDRDDRYDAALYLRDEFRRLAERA